MKDNYPDFARITRNASKTFYNSSLLYPKKLRNDIYILYSFLRTSDDMVDAENADISGYEAFKQETRRALAGNIVKDPIVQAFANLIKRRAMDPRLVWDYFASQDIDLRERSYETYSDLSKFIYGVAEVVGLYMAQLMELHTDSYPYARKLGEAMQLVNIARDIDEDTKAGKCYIPQTELRECGISEPLTKVYAQSNQKKFTKIMHIQLNRAKTILQKSREGLQYFPKQYKLPICVSMVLYERVITKIYADPLIVFQEKVRPSTSTIFITVLSEWLKVMGSK